MYPVWLFWPVGRWIMIITAKLITETSILIYFIGTMDEATFSYLLNPNETDHTF